jgi:DNA-binding transcriptional LysR family regulator
MRFGSWTCCSATVASRVPPTRLHTRQPALSKRVYFNEPMFVRVAMHMEPTAKALELEKPVRALLDGFQRLLSEQSQFDIEWQCCQQIPLGFPSPLSQR